MSIKVECPGCGGYSSSIWSAFREDEPCPYCGLSASAALEIETVRKSKADEDIKQKYEEMLKRATKAEGEVMRLQQIVWNVQEAVGEDDSD